ncbi:MAG: hypothetical protein JO243_06845 [Solirubrobacterales bacterium]|nr:hypothetical protein [Solirubrobacterales bacterium]
MRIVRRELQIIRDDLHCNAVRICGTDLGRVKRTAEQALSLGLETWLCPEIFEHDQSTTLRYIAGAARTAEALRRRWPGQIVLSIATELSVFMPGILEGARFTERIASPTLLQQIFSEAYSERLNAFLAAADVTTRRSYQGPVTYAAAPFEPVDWNIFDLASLDLYRDHTNRSSFDAPLRPALAYGKPVVISEVGLCTYRGAEHAGGMGWAIIDHTSRPLQLNGEYKRDEELQASELIDMLERLDGRRVDGVFVMTFVSPLLTHREDPRHDLDMASYSLVKSYHDRNGTTYPDMPWEPKQSFNALARHFAERGNTGATCH